MRKLLYLLLFISTPAWSATATLSWDYTAADIATYGVTGFQVERKPSLCGVGTAPFTIITTTAATARSYVDATLVPGGSYCYRVAAKAPVSTNTPTGLSAYSNTVEKAVPLGPVPPPTNLLLTFLDALIEDIKAFKAALLAQ